MLKYLFKSGEGGIISSGDHKRRYIYFSFTHREKPLGSPYGPSSKTMRIESFYFPNPRIIIEFSFEHILKGFGSGSSILDNYDTRNKELDWSTNFFLEDKLEISEFKTSLTYVYSDLLTLTSVIYLTQTLNPLAYDVDGKSHDEKFIVGLNFSW